MTSSTAKVNVGTLSKADRKKLATRIKAARAKGQAWDGEKGICVEMKISGAPVGRQLLREIGQDGMIAKTYDHKAAATARKPKPAAKKARKPSAKKPVAKPAPTEAAVKAIAEMSDLS